MGRFLHIYIQPPKGTTQEALEEKLNSANDWYRYDTGLYVVYTTSKVETWQARLVDLVKMMAGCSSANYLYHLGTDG